MFMPSPNPKLSRWLSVPVLSRRRIGLAFAVAGVADFVQLFLGPVGWVFGDEIIDVVAMVLTCATLGFHPLLLPTFIVELIPVADMLPTWTGCVAAVVFFRRRAQQKEKMAQAEVINEPLPPPTLQIQGPGSRTEPKRNP
jgi:hypothetical protein